MFFSRATLSAKPPNVGHQQEENKSKLMCSTVGEESWNVCHME